MNVKNKSCDEKNQNGSCKETQLKMTEKIGAAKKEAAKSNELDDNKSPDNQMNEKELIGGEKLKVEEKSCYAYDMNKSIDENLIGFFAAASGKRSHIFQGFIDHAYDEKMWKVTEEEKKTPPLSTLFDFSDYDEDDFGSSDNEEDEDEDEEVNENHQVYPDVMTTEGKENGESKCKRQRMNSVENDEVQQPVATNDENGRTNNLLVVNVNNGNK